MRILHVSNSDMNGGAAIAAYRLHHALRKANVQSRMKVRVLIGKDPDIEGIGSIVRQTVFSGRHFLVKHFIKAISQKKDGALSINFFSTGLGRYINRCNCDIVHLHWVNKELISLSEIGEINKPVVWTLHDMWPFTGGCHYTDTCTRYQNSCGSCPELGSNSKHDLSWRIIQKKKKYWCDMNLTVVSPSTWMSQCAESSQLFRGISTKIIHNGIDTTLFKPTDRNAARKTIGFPIDKTLLCFGAFNALSEKRKGFHLLRQCFEHLKLSVPSDDIEFVVFGASCNDPNDLLHGYRIHYMGTIRDAAKIALLLSSCDLFLAPSIQDNLPNTILEAMSCGTPCVAFNVGGISDLVGHGKNGYLAKPYDIRDLAEGIQWAIGQSKKRPDISKASRYTIEVDFDINSISRQYMELYRSIL